MATKQNPGAFDRLASAEPDEPYFVLLARDGEGGVQAWLAWIIARLEAVRDGRKPMADVAQVQEALAGLYDAAAWRAAHSRAGRPGGVDLPGPADRAWINNTLDILRGKASETAAERLADDQGIRR